MNLHAVLDEDVVAGTDEVLDLRGIILGDEVSRLDLRKGAGGA